MSIKNEPVPRDLHIATMARRDARIAELTAEVEKLREALKDVKRGADNYHSHVFISDIARNALKEGV